MASDRKKKRNLDLLKNAVDSNRENGGAPRGGGAPGGGGGGGRESQIMYRGKPVGRSGGGSAPGAPGGQRPAPSQSQPSEGGDVKQALAKLTQLFNDGLITKAEYDAKRAEILNRL